MVGRELVLFCKSLKRIRSKAERTLVDVERKSTNAERHRTRYTRSISKDYGLVAFVAFASVEKF